MWLPLALSLMLLLGGCNECSDCGGGPIPVAYLRVITRTTTGSLSGVDVRLDRQGFTPLAGTTDLAGEYLFEVLEVAAGEAATLTTTPNAGLVAPPPQTVTLEPSDTVEVDVLLEPGP